MGFDLISYVLGIATMSFAVIVGLFVVGIREVNKKNKQKSFNEHSFGDWDWNDVMAEAAKNQPTNSRSTPPNVSTRKTK